MAANSCKKWPFPVSFYLFSSSLYLTKCKYVISSLFYFMSTGKTTKNYFNYLNLYYLSQARDDQNFILLVLVILVLSNGFVNGWKNLSMHACMHLPTYLPTYLSIYLSTYLPTYLLIRRILSHF